MITRIKKQKIHFFSMGLLRSKRRSRGWRTHTRTVYSINERVGRVFLFGEFRVVKKHLWEDFWEIWSGPTTMTNCPKAGTQDSTDYAAAWLLSEGKVQEAAEWAQK